ARVELESRGLGVSNIEEITQQDSTDTPIVASLADDSDWTQVEPFLNELLKKQRGNAELVEAFAAEFPGRARKDLMELVSHLRQGATASVAFKDGAHLPPAAISLLALDVERAESDDHATGFIGSLNHSAQLSGRIARIFNYPAILLSVLVVYALLVYMFIIPMFREIFLDFELDLPPPTILVFSISPYVAGIGGFVLLLILLWFFRGLIVPRSFREECSIRIPVLGSTYTHAYASQFCEVAAVLLLSNSPFGACFRIAGKATLPESLADDINFMTLNHTSLQRTGSRLPCRLCVALESNNSRDSMAQLLNDLGRDFHERVAAPTSRIYEPIFMILTAGGVGFVVISLMLPLIALIQNLSG
ncbi:MAG: hypothetical protein AAF497_14775, partial [Planctomycetota bacterium]